jgi:replicative DNA helicase
MEMLYSKSYSGFVLGSIMNDTSLLTSSKYRLTKADFEPFSVHKNLFVCIAMLTDSGVRKIEPKDVAEVLKNYPEVENSIIDEISGGNYLDYIQTLLDLDNKYAFDYYYEEVRKRTLLRKYRDSHIDISNFFDEDKSQDSQDAKLLTVKLKDIVDFYDKIQYTLRNEFIIRDNEEQYLAGSDFAETKKRLKEAPLVGASFMSDYVNEVFCGAYGFIVLGAKSGDGKTVFNVGNACVFSALEYYDLEQKKFVKNRKRVGNTLFINTEMDIRTELDIMLVSCISGVERRHIKMNEYLDGEEERVDRAGEILKQSGIYVVDMPEFTSKDLTERIDEYVKMYDIKNVIFDYIQNNGFVSKEISNEQNIPMREDQVLLTLTDRLKMCQRANGVGLISAVQTNGKEDELSFPTEACLAGGKSQIRKLDGCVIMLAPNKLEQKVIEEWLMTTKANTSFGNKVLEPNRVVHLIKGRGTDKEKHTKLFINIDFGICRYYDCFATDVNNHPIDMSGLEILAEVA